MLHTFYAGACRAFSVTSPQLHQQELEDFHALLTYYDSRAHLIKITLEHSSCKWFLNLQRLTDSKGLKRS